jgi:hypothetical protein
MRFDEAQLQHPLERPIFIAYVVMNIAVVVAGIVMIKVGSNWVGTHPLFREYLETHPVFTDFIQRIAAVIILAIIAPLAIPVVRGIHSAFIRGNSIRLSREQIPQIYGILEAHCEKLGACYVPELYLSEEAISGPAQAFSDWRRDYIVLNLKLAESEIEENRAALAFMLGRELGRIRLGHLKWWNEMLIAHVSKIPFLRSPLLAVRTYSCDRYGAFLAASGLNDLLAQATGRQTLKNLNLEDYLRQARDYRGFWAQLASIVNESPPLLRRAQALCDAGFFQLDQGRDQSARDEGRDEGEAPAERFRPIGG